MVLNFKVFSLGTKQLCGSASFHLSGTVPFFQITLHKAHSFRSILGHFLYTLYVTPLGPGADPEQAFFKTDVIYFHDAV